MTAMNPALVFGALDSLGGVANLQDIYKQFAVLYPDLLARYESQESFQGTIRQAIQSACPQATSYRPGNPVFFEQVEEGRYRAVYQDRRDEVIGRGRHL
ncbi:hypothetical protein J421_5357 (plasmid) [Gemmatirosa kalamazoonensis]|uniref:Uncharacterized protein n=1 Tax=Gemmatirosa kalamazoonensis TaxID=861299 RepID=W0RQZ7_9BACT|nr:hypothetical protein [Gemmatirosa kalamazoonensis]AHG92892.1 hypothetical protein J421_5357 [Gemmatirosa kalamazoonensis]